MSPSASGSSGPPTAGVDGRWWRDTVSGATAGMVSVLALHPLDVIKTRLQVQDGIDRRAATYRGTVHAFRTVVRSEGALGLYAGLSPAVIGSTLSWAAYFGCYNNAKQRYAAMFEVEHLPSHLHLLSAAEAGLVVSLATNPIWVAKTRLQLQRREPSRAPEGGGARTAGGGAAAAPYRGFVDCITRIARAEGVPGLYRGIAPSLFLVSHGALQFAAYEKLKRWWTAAAAAGGDDAVGLEPGRAPGGRPAEPSAFACAWLGVASKIFASTVTYPSQVVRSRMQQRGAASDRGPAGGGEGAAAAAAGGGGGRPRYSSFARSLADISRREGVAGLYKGMVPNVMRTLPSSGVTFMVYESTRALLEERGGD